MPFYLLAGEGGFVLGLRQVYAEFICSLISHLIGGLGLGTLLSYAAFSTLDLGFLLFLFLDTLLVRYLLP